MPQNAYEDGLKRAQELAQRAVSAEGSVSSLPPLASPLPTLHRAFPLYIASAESYSHLLSSSLVPSEGEKTQIRKKWRLVLERAEKVKRRIESLGGNVGKALMTDEGEEDLIIRRGSTINGVSAEPWSSRDASPHPNTSDRDDRFVDTLQPELADSSQAEQVQWRELSSECWTTRLRKEDRWVAAQGPGADCSVVAGLSACLDHNRQWGKNLGGAALYPQDAKGRSPQSQDGRYTVRLFLNGSWRKVIIDSQLPFSSDGRPLYPAPRNLSSSRRSFNDIHPLPWVPLVSKAYFKVHGGYSLRGSNPSPDIYELTGWIPERLGLTDGFRREKEWKRLLTSWNRGDVLLTLGTGEQTGPGIVPLHAYAILGMREEGGERVVEVYDPGVGIQHEGDPAEVADGMTSMTLGEPSSGSGEGRFKKTWDQVCSEFDTLNLNWDPKSLPVTTRRHWSWRKPVSINEDNLNDLELTPRYRLNVTIDPAQADSQVWILLSQHITSKDRPLDDIALRVIEEYDVNAGASSKLQNQHPRKASDSVPYSNANHVLVRQRLRRGTASFLLLPIRDRGIFKTDFTLQVLAPRDAGLSLERISRSLAFSTSVTGQMTSRNSGGHSGHPSWVDNPQYALKISPGAKGQANGQLRIMLSGNSDLAWNVKLLYGQGSRVNTLTSGISLGDSGAYTQGACFLDCSELKAGTYTLVVSTFEPGQTGAFKLALDSDLPLELVSIPQEGAGMYSRIISRIWTADTAAGRPSTGTYTNNSRVEIVLPKPCSLSARLFMRGEMGSPIPLNLTAFKRATGGTLDDQIATSGPYSDDIYGVQLPRTKFEPGVYVLVPSAWEAGMGVGEEWELRIWADSPMEVDIER